MSKKSKTYYERNRENILVKTNLRYKLDPNFRVLHIQRVKAYKQRKAKERKDEKEKSKYEKSIWREFNIEGVVTPCCRVGFVASNIGRSAQTLRLWERSGFLPKTIRHKTQRYYPKYHYLLILRMWRLYLDKKYNITIFYRNVWDDWDKEKEEWLKRKK